MAMHLLLLMVMLGDSARWPVRVDGPEHATLGARNDHGDIRHNDTVEILPSGRGSGPLIRTVREDRHGARPPERLGVRWVVARIVLLRWSPMTRQIPLVDYLVLGEPPHLVAQVCSSCGALFFGRRNACAACFNAEFSVVPVATAGTVETFTVVAQAAPGVSVPFVAAVVDCDGTPVRANLINVEPDPQHVTTGMKVRLATYSLGLDDDGVEAIGFAFEPMETSN